MAFGTMTGAGLEKEDGRIRGKQEAVACDCWFTSKGHTIPRWIKYQDKEGMIHSISNIRILCVRKRRYCGIETIEYECCAGQDGRYYEFLLLFHIEVCSWKIIWKK